MTTERFDKAAATWDNKSRRVQLAEKISTAISTLPLHKNMTAMEFGCGTGLVSLALAPQLKSLVALDTSQGMLDVLQEKIDEQQQNNMRCLNFDILEDNYKGRHDLIICSMTLHHLQDADGLLQRFSELLNPGGYLAVADLVTEDGSFHDPSAEGIYHKGFEPAQLENTLATLNMTDIKSRTVHTIKKETTRKEYPIFLLTAQKQN